MTLLRAKQGCFFLACILLLVFVIARAFGFGPGLNGFFIGWQVLSASTIAFLILSGERPSSPPGSRALDCAVLFLVLTELILLIGSTYRRNSFLSLFDLASLVTLYLLFRLVATQWAITEWTVPAVAVMAAVVAGYGAAQYIKWGHTARALGLLDLSALKGIAPAPLGSLESNWATVLLAFLPFSVAATFSRPRWLRSTGFAASCLVVFALLLTLSRGAYCGVITFLVVFAGFALAMRLAGAKTILYLLLMLIASSVAIRLFAPSTNGELWQLFKKQTLSQSRSVDGRLASCRNAITLFSEHPLIGVGPNNFALQYVPLAGAGSAPFVGRTYNIALSILVERGGLGFLAYGFLLFAVLRAELFHMRWDLGANRIWAALRAAGIIALLARDATNSTLLTVAPVSMLLWLLFSMAACRASDTRLAADTPLPSRFPLSLVTAATVLGLAGALLTSYYAFRYSEAYGHFLAARKFVQAAQYSSAEAALDTAIREDPDNSYYYAARGLVLARSFQPPDDVESGPCGIQPQPQPRADILARSTDDIRHALKLNPNDDGLYYSLASLRWYAGDWPGFEYNVRRAIAVDRDEPLYHIALAKIFEHHGAEDFADAEYLTAVLDRPQILSSRWYRNLEQCSPARAQKIAQRAIDEFTTRLRSQDQDSALLRAELGSVFLRVGRLRDATTELDAAVVALPQLPRAWLNLGKALNAAGRQREAKRAFEESIFLHWNDPNPHEELAPLLYSNGEFSAAADQWEIALRPLQEQEHSSRIARVYNVKAIDNGNDLIGPRSITCIQPEVDRAQAARSLAATLKILGRDDKTTQN